MEKPNILVIMTDEQNLRTIGKYRDLFRQSYPNSTQHTHPWGEGVEVLTEHIDSLAEDGAIFSNFYTVSPICTTSRGTFMTGTYPSTNGAKHNHQPMNDDAVTFAEELQDYGYSTSYMGKVGAMFVGLVHRMFVD